MTTTVKTRTKKTVPAPKSRTEICAELRELQRRNVVLIQSRVMQNNRLQAVVAGTLGYGAHLEPEQRKAKFGEAEKVIKAVLAGEAHPLKDLIVITASAIKELKKIEAGVAKSLSKLAEHLPVAPWVLLPEQRGFGLKSLGQLVGETGDLSNYQHLPQLWKRLGCAPHYFDGKWQMGSTWKLGINGSLPAAEWERYGYCPRRRALTYVFGENLIKLNYLTGEGGSGVEGDGDDIPTAEDEEQPLPPGPYRQRYLDAKRIAYDKHPEWAWKPCTRCGGEKLAARDCLKCQGTGAQCQQANRHGNLLAVKLLIENLYKEWKRLS